MDTRTILEDVAAGRLSPDEATRLMSTSAGAAADDGTDAAAARAGAEGHDDVPDADASDNAAAPAGAGFSVKITATARAVRIIGDPGVKEASVEGRHRAERTGDALAIDGSVQAGDETGFFFDGPGSWHRQWRQFTEPLVVRVNPEVPVQAEVSAGSLTVNGVTGPLSFFVAAGSARLEDVGGPLDVETRAGAVRISGRIDTGQSSIRCEAGSVSLHLLRGSSATIRARAELGRVKMHGAPGKDTFTGGYREVVVGAGTGAIQIDTTMGSVEVGCDDWMGPAAGPPPA